MRRFAGMLSILGLLIGGSVLAQNAPNGCVYECQEATPTEPARCIEIGNRFPAGTNCGIGRYCFLEAVDPDGPGPEPVVWNTVCRTYCQIDHCTWI